MNKRFAHPEAEADEVWIGNVMVVDYRNIGWTTKRLGKKPYDSFGQPLNGGNMRPVMVQRSEIVAHGIPIPVTGPVDHLW